MIKKSVLQISIFKRFWFSDVDWGGDKIIKNNIFIYKYHLVFGQSHQLRLVKDYLFCNEIKENIKNV